MNGILALGLLLTASSQLRIAGAPLGPGELCLVVWIVISLARVAGGSGLRLTPALSAMAMFWGVFALAESLGTLTALATGEDFDADLLLHDAIAYPLLAAASGLSVAGPGAALRLRRVAWLLVILGAMSLGSQFANVLGVFGIAGIDPWFWERFRGWSSNPNQLALLCVVLSLVALYLADTVANLGPRLGAICCIVPPVVLGRLSQSDTFTLAVFAAALIYVAGKLVVWLRSGGHDLSLRSSLARLTILALPLVLLSVSPLALSGIADAQKFAMGLTKNGGTEVQGEADLRLALWREAITRGLDSGMLGLGPGPHLQIPPSIVAGHNSANGRLDNVINPEQNGTANFEAHNTVLDLFTQGGLLAVLSFVSLMMLATMRAYLARSAGLVALIAGVMVFGLTGLIVRQPIFWFAVWLCITAEAARGESRVIARRVWQPLMPS
jgi:hypothetical protein